jgi:acyl carrier protein
MALTYDEALTKVKEVLTSALAVDDDQVQPKAKLNADLGAESIDYLDITFQLEKAFKIKIPQNDLIPQNLFTDPRFVSNGMVTADGLAELHRLMPFADLSEFDKNPNINSFRDVFTVDTLVRYVMLKVNGNIDGMPPSGGDAASGVEAPRG